MCIGDDVAALGGCCWKEMLLSMSQSIWFKIFIIQGVIGILLFEWAYASTYRIRMMPEEFHAQFPAFRRTDVQKWARWKFYPGAFCLLFARFLIYFGALFILGFIWRFIVYRGQDMSLPPTGWRAWVKRKSWSWICLTWYSLCLGYHQVSNYKTNEDVKDLYAKYLGPNWIEEEKERVKKREESGFKRCSTIISNHHGPLDITALVYSKFTPCFTPASFVKKFPIGDFYCKGCQSMYVERNDGKAGLDKTVQTIIDRQTLTETGELPWGPLVVFAEGTVTNQTHIGRFRRGGFAGLKPVQPCWISYDYSVITPGYEALKGLQLGLMACCTNLFPTQRLTLDCYPMFEPNEYMWKKFADPSKEKWEIYANCMQDLFITERQLPVNPQPSREKVNYQEFLWGLKDEITVNGKKWYWPQNKKPTAVEPKKDD